MRHIPLRSLCSLAFSLLFLTSAFAQITPDALTSRTGGEAGLVVFVEPSGPAGAIELAAGGRHLVLALSASAESARQWTEAMTAARVHPLAEARHWLDPSRLPFQDNAVNTLILRRHEASRLGRDEVLRVIAPGHGFALVDGQEIRKPRPEGMDVWLGRNRDATGNRLSRDLLDPPNSIQWLGGRQGVPASIHIISDRVHFIHGSSPLPRYRTQFGRESRDTHARDAFSGVTLWNQARGMGSYINWSFITFTDGERLFLPKPDAGRGPPPNRRGDPPRELDMMSVNLLTGEVMQPELPLIRWNERLQRQEIQQGDWGENNFFSHRLISDGRRMFFANGGNLLRALSADGTELLWEKTFPEGEYTDMIAYDGTTLAVLIASTDDNPFMSMRLFPRHDNIAKYIVGLDPATGEQRWRYDGVEGHALKYFINEFGAVVASSHLANPRRARDRASQSGAPSHEQVANNLLVSLDAATGREHFRRAGAAGFPDVPNLIGQRAGLNVAPNHIIYNESNAAYVFDLRTGELKHENNAGSYGYFTRFSASTLRWVIRNNVFASYDGTVADATPHFVSTEDYSGFSKPANNMFYITSGFRSSSSPRWIGDQLALSRQSAFPPAVPDENRLLVRGTARGLATPAAADWPTFRGDFARRGWRPADGPGPELELSWSARVPLPLEEGTLPYVWTMNSDVPGLITQPVADARNVLISIPDRHEIVSLNPADGSERWRVRLGGRVAAPPTLAGGTAFVGVNDGTVSAIDLESGAVVWTFLAAPYERLHNAHLRMESTHPVRSSPVLHNGRLFVTAGRHGSIDNGMMLWALNPATGAPLGRLDLDHAHINDVMQLLVDGTLVLVDTQINPDTLEITFSPGGGQGPSGGRRSGSAPSGTRSSAPLLRPNDRGHDGGHGWIGPTPIWMGQHLRAGERNFGQRVGPGLRTVTQRDDRFSTFGGVSYAERSLEDPNVQLREINLGEKLRIGNTFARRDMPEYMAGAGRYQYVVARGGRNQLLVAVIDTETGDARLTQVDAESPQEEILPDGLAIAHGRLLVATTTGRVLAFRAK